MSDKISSILNLLADMVSSIPGSDDLSALVQDYTESDELFEDDLSYVSAAGSKPDYQAFIRRFGLQNPQEGR